MGEDLARQYHTLQTKAGKWFQFQMPGKERQEIRKYYSGKAVSVPLDLGGEGRNKGVINVNLGTKKTTTPGQPREIPLLIQGRFSDILDEFLFPDSAVDMIYCEASPFPVRQAMRVIKPGGTISIWNDADVVNDWYREMLKINPNIDAKARLETLETTLGPVEAVRLIVRDYREVIL